MCVREKVFEIIQVVNVKLHPEDYFRNISIILFLPANAQFRRVLRCNSQDIFEPTLNKLKSKGYICRPV